MPLKDYSTSIDARRTLGEIQGTLAEAGASDISIRYDPATKRPIALSFSIHTPLGERWFTLPANIAPVLATLRQQKARTSRIQATPEQAERVAWRILKDWLEAQLAIIQTGMVAFDQVMLPYMQADEEGHTVYELASKFLLPAPQQR